MIPPVVARANILAAEHARLDAEVPKGLYLLHADPQFRAFHTACLPRQQKRRDGSKITPEWALAEAKLSMAEALDEAIAWLQPKERMAILLDPALIGQLVQLPREPLAPEAAAPAM